MRVTRRKSSTHPDSASRIGAVALGALAGLALGMLLADRGLLAGRRKRSASRATPGDQPLRGATPPASGRPTHTEGAPPRSVVDDEADLESRVLETFRNDPILVDRPIDIGAIGTGIIELTGWVDAPSEIRHATTLTRGTIGVSTVVNRLVVRGGTSAA
jgi:BON domain